MNKIITIAVLSSLPLSAHAYLDPGTGSLIVQAVIGTIAGAFMFLKLYWGKIKTFFSKENKSEKSE